MTARVAFNERSAVYQAAFNRWLDSVGAEFSWQLEEAFRGGWAARDHVGSGRKKPAWAKAKIK